MGQKSHAEPIRESSYVKHATVQVSRAEIYEGNLELVNRANPIKQSFYDRSDCEM
jgi:hypothetical protein